MKADQTARQQILRESYRKLVLINIATLAAITLCGVIDNVVISSCLDDRALAAVGYFSPVSAVIGLPSVIIFGSLILIGNYIGSGKQDEVNALFTSSYIVIVAFCSLFALVMTVFRNPLASVLGASHETHELLAQYILGFAPGIVFSSLASLLISLAAYNNEIKRSYTATAALLLGNTAADLLLAKPMGIFGIGLASTLSSLAAFLIILPAYLSGKKTVHFVTRTFDIRLVAQSVRRGLPSLLFTGGMLIKNSLMNYSLSLHFGYEGIAVANVLASVCSITGTFTGGFSNAFSSLASLSYGENDRDAFIGYFPILLLHKAGTGIPCFSYPFTGNIIAELELVEDQRLQF